MRGRTDRQLRTGTAAIAAVIAALLLTACGGDGDGAAGNGGGGSGAGGYGADDHVHVHGLGVNPTDGALIVATHTGLFRSAPETTGAERIGDGRQDVMGFTVVGPDRFLASGHPAPGEDRPANLGLVESSDGGETWEEVAFAGEADFHVLRHAHGRIYAHDVLGGELMLSGDGGRTWTRRMPPAPVIDLAVDPGDPRRIVLSTEAGLGVSPNEGRRWTRLPGEIGLLAWPAPRRLYLIDAGGAVRLSEDGGRGWRAVGSIGGQPAAFAAAGERELYAALEDGTVLESSDGGATWDERVEP